jgi:hypothetical protein
MVLQKSLYCSHNRAENRANFNSSVKLGRTPHGQRRSSH